MAASTNWRGPFVVVAIRRALLYGFDVSVVEFCKTAHRISFTRSLPETPSHKQGCHSPPNLKPRQHLVCPTSPEATPKHRTPSGHNLITHNCIHQSYQSVYRLDFSGHPCAHPIKASPKILQTILAGSYSKALYGKYRQPTNKTVIW